MQLIFQMILGMSRILHNITVTVTIAITATTITPMTMSTTTTTITTTTSAATTASATTTIILWPFILIKYCHVWSMKLRVQDQGEDQRRPGKRLYVRTVKHVS